MSQILDTEDGMAVVNAHPNGQQTCMATDYVLFCQPKQRIVIALYGFNARENGDLSFAKGDRMKVLDDFNTNWRLVVNLSTLEKGLIPWNYVAEEEWLFDQFLRNQAQQLLLAAENPRGTFLVRPSDCSRKGYTLFVKDFEEDEGYCIKHYKIVLENGGFYISTDKPFGSLLELINAYKKDPMGICHVLVKACPKPQSHILDLGPNISDRWEIDRNELQIIKHLGQGNFADIYHGKWRENTEVAVKRFRESTMRKDAFLQEAAIMKKLCHKNLVTLYAVCSKEEPILIVHEFMCNGILLEFLRHGDGKHLELKELIYIAAQIGSGVEYLESKMVIHCDLAARNVLVGKNNVAKICEFGLAQMTANGLYFPKQGTQFPVKWTAPEAIIDGLFSIKSDVWSFGILLMELFTYGQVPYPGMHGRDVIDAVGQGYRMPQPVSHTLPDDIYKVILSCWDPRPEKRPTFEYLSHYFNTFTFAPEMAYLEADPLKSI